MLRVNAYGGGGGFVGAQSLNRTDCLWAELREYIPRMLASSGLSFLLTAFGTMGWVDQRSSPGVVAVEDGGGDDPLRMPREAEQPGPVCRAPRLSPLLVGIFRFLRVGALSDRDDGRSHLRSVYPCVRSCWSPRSLGAL